VGVSYIYVYIRIYGFVYVRIYAFWGIDVKSGSLSHTRPHATCPYMKVDVRLPEKNKSKSHSARPVHLIITMTKWFRTSRLSIKKSLPAPPPPSWVRDVVSETRKRFEGRATLAAAAEREGGEREGERGRERGGGRERESERARERERESEREREKERARERERERARERERERERARESERESER